MSSVAVVGGRGRRRAGAAQPRRQPPASCPATSPPTSSCSPAPARTPPPPPSCCAAGPTWCRRAGAPDDVRELLDLDAVAREHGATLVVGAAVSPGPVRPARPRTSSSGWRRATSSTSPSTAPPGRPAPASTTGRSPGGRSAGTTAQWIERAAGSGRELCWFPEPVGARDCYRAELADPMLLHRSFPDVGADQRPAVGDPSRPPHGTPADAQPAAPRGRHRRRARRGPRPRRARRTGDPCRRHRRADRHGGGGDGRGDGRRASLAATARRRRDHHRRRRPADGVDRSRNVLRYGVRLQEFTGIPHTG